MILDYIKSTQDMHKTSYTADMSVQPLVVSPVVHQMKHQLSLVWLRRFVDSIVV